MKKVKKLVLFCPPLTNSYYKWTWAGFVLLGDGFTPHIGSIQYNVNPTGSGQLVATGYIAIVMKPLPFMLRGEPARVLIYVLPEFEWDCYYVFDLSPDSFGDYLVRDGSPFILGDGYAFHGTVVIHGNNGYNYTNSYGGADAYIWLIPKKSSS